MQEEENKSLFIELVELMNEWLANLDQREQEHLALCEHPNCVLIRSLRDSRTAETTE